MLHRLLTAILLCALPSSAWAGPIAESVAAQAKTVAQQQPTGSRWSTAEVVTGAALVATGFVVAMYGFGNPTGPAPDPDERGVFPHRSAVGFVGIGLAAAGGVLTWHGFRGASSIATGPHEISVQHRIAF